MANERAAAVAGDSGAGRGGPRGQQVVEVLRGEIIAQVNREHGGLLRWPALMQPLYLERMYDKYGETPPESPQPSALDATRRILQETGGE